MPAKKKAAKKKAAKKPAKRRSVLKVGGSVTTPVQPYPDGGEQ